MPESKPPGLRQRRNKTSTRAMLSSVVDHKVPPMPDAEEWLRLPPAEMAAAMAAGWKPRWAKPVVDWWENLWQSPMSNEFLPSDIGQLYLACYYLELSLDPTLKVPARLAAARQHEMCVKQFGLSPMSRRSLQWEVARADSATMDTEAKTQRRRSKADKDSSDDPRAHPESDDENPFKPRIA